MEAGLVSAFEGFGLQQAKSSTIAGTGLMVPGAIEDGETARILRKQRSQRFTVPVSPPRQSISSSPSPVPTSLDSSLPFQPPPLPVETQSRPQQGELYSTPVDGHGEQGDEEAETRQEYAGSSESEDEGSETSSRLRPAALSLHHHQPDFIRQTAHAPLHYPRHQPPLFYNSTSHASMPLSPPSLFNLVPGGSPTFTYHHSFPPQSSSSSSSLPPPPASSHHQASSSSPSYPTFIPPPPPPGFGLGVGTEDANLFRMGPPSVTLSNNPMMSAIRRNPSPNGGGFPIDADDDEIIETAIVIKSIPFSCPKDQLLALMGSLQLPSPLAFNYHYDLSLNPQQSQQHQQPEPRQDQFRGLAFANFRNGEEARVVVCALNGFEFMGRKLRAEFKKVLKPGEKEAIERNKALKRIRSVQLLANGGNVNGSNSYNGGGPYGRGGGGGGGNSNGWGDGSNRSAGAGAWNRREASSAGGVNTNFYRGYEPDEAATEEYGRLLHNHSQAQIGGGGNGNKTLFGQREYVVPSGIGMAYANSGESLGGGSGSVDMSGSASGSGSLMSSRAGTAGGLSGSGSDSEEGVGSSVSVREERKKDLDLNDPQTLQLYSQLLLFSSSPSPPNPSTTEFESMNSLERRKLKMIAKMLGLGYGSEDAHGGGKRVRLWKTSPQSSLRSAASATPLRRPASASSFHTTPTASSSFVPPPVPTLPAFSAYLSTANSGALRGKKSMPEFRPSASSSSFYAANDAPPIPMNPYSRPQLNGFNRKSTNNLRAESPSHYHSQSSSTSSFQSSPGSKRIREMSSVQGLFQQHGIMPDSASPGEEKREFYSTGLGSGGAEAVRQPRGPGNVESSPARGVGSSEGGLEWRARRA